jgi:hypothetical protein
MLRIVIALVLLAHGIGHSMGLLQLFRVATINPEWHGDSWLLAGGVGTTVAQAAGAIAWVVAIAGFSAIAGIVIGWLPASWWAPVALGAAAASIVGLVLFPTAFPTFSTVAALAVDIVVLAAVLWLRWTPAQLT